MDDRPGGRLVTTPFLLAFGANFVMALSFSNNALFPLYVTHEGGGPDSIGMFMALFSIAAVVSRPLVGLLVDRWGLKPVWIAGIVFMALPPLGFNYLLGSGLTWLIWTLRTIQGIGFGAHFTAAFTLAGLIAPEGRRTESMAKYGLSGMAAHMIGPYIGEQLIQRAGLEVFLPVMTGFAILALGFVIFLPDMRETKSGGQVPAPAEILRSLRHPSMILTLVLALCLSMSYTTPSAFLAPVATSRGISGFSLYFTAFSVCGIIVRLIGSKWGDRFGLRRVLLPGFAFYSTALLLLAASNSLAWLIIAGCFGGLGHGLVFPAVSSMGYSQAPKGMHGSAMALVTGMMDTGNGITAFILGKIADQAGYQAVFPSGAVGPVIALLILTASLLRKPKPI